FTIADSLPFSLNCSPSTPSSPLSINHHPPSIVDQLEDLSEAFHPWIGA
ncbi:hypothetical protein LINPERHAP2_LOCUS35134, partial [Linum perenne]